MSRRASVYARKGILYIRATSLTDAGVWIQDGPCATVPSSAPPAEIGAAVVEALASSRSGVPHPTDWKAVGAPLQKAAGVKTFGAFAKLARSIDVRQDEDIVLTPRKNLGAKGGGFVPIDEKVIRIPATRGAAEIGEAVRAAIEASE